MLSLHWLSQLWSPRRSQPLHRERTKERRLKLLRLEQRRVLNADFSFTPQTLTLSNVDGDLSVREVSSGLTSQIEFDLAGSIWQDDGSTGTFAIDNSTPGHSILSIEKSDLENLSGGASLSAAASSFDVHFDVQSSSLDLSQMRGSLVVEGFGTVSQTASSDHDVQVADVSLSANQIQLSSFHGDDITLNANEIDLNGGDGSFSGTTLSILSAASHLELSGSSDSPTALDFTGSDIAALDAGFTSIHFSSLSSGESSTLTIDESGADFRDAFASQAADSHPGSLHLEAATVQIHGDLTSNGGLIEIDATDEMTVSATGAVISHGGEVHLDAGEHGTLLVAGDVDVSDADAGDSGGTVHLLGERIGLFGDARVDASGDSGGGEVLIGGDSHGDNAAIHHAAQVFVGRDVELSVDAIQHGDGGKLVVWSDEVTQVYGSLSARGGSDSGDGGFIETSSLEQLLLTSGGDASAANGHAGTWLLDPLNVRVVSVSTIYGITEFATPPNFNPAISGSEVTAIAITEQLEAGTNVILTTRNPDGPEAGDVIVDADLHVNFLNPGDTATFIISAANDVFINGEITATNGSLNILLEANEGSDDLDTSLGNVNVNRDIDTNGGIFVSTGVDFDSAGVKPANAAATITATGGVSITHTGVVDLGAVFTGLGFGGTTFINGANVRENIDVGEGNVFVDGGNDDLIVLANITSTDTIFLLADQDVIIEATVTAGAPDLMNLNPTADLSITADAESNGGGGVWIREGGNPADARLNAGGNISIVGAKLIDVTGNTTGSISLRIDVSDIASDPQIVAGQDLTIVANFDNVADAGDIIIDGILQATDGALTAFFTGTSFLSADQFAGTDLLFQNAVQLTDNVTLTAGNDATLASTVDDDGVAGTDSSLTVMAGGDVLFVEKVGGMVDGALDALTVTSDGLIDFLNSVTVAGNILVTATSEIDRVTFQGVVTTTNGGSVTITNAGLLVTSSAAEFHLASDFLQNGIGSTELGASIDTIDGDVTFDQAVVLTDAVAIDTNLGNRGITFGGSIDSEVTGANEEQTLSLQDVTGGSYTISWGPPGGAAETTDPILYDAPAADVQMALAALDSLADGDILVLGDPSSFYTLIFRGAYRGTNVDPIIATDVDLTGGVPLLSVLTVIEGQPVVAEHNPLTLIAGAGQIVFQGDIGNGFVDFDLGIDGDQTLGDFTIKTASNVTFDGVSMVAAAGSIGFGADDLIPSGILITGVNPISFQSDQNIRVNGVTTSEVDLSLLAAGDVTLTDDGSIDATTNSSNVTIVADSNGDSLGDLVMKPLTDIDAGSGFIDISAAEVFLGKLTSDSTNSTDADNPAIRVIATFRAINDFNGDELNLVANHRISPDDTGAGVVLEAVLGIGSNDTADDALETDIASLSAFNHDLSEQQMVTLENANAGDFTISWERPDGSGSATTDPIPFNASADDVKVLFLQTFSSLTNADVEVSGNPGGPFVFTFTGALRRTDVAPLTVDGTNLIGVGPSVTAGRISDPVPARNNVILQDVGTTAGRVDLIFVHNDANQLEPQFAIATDDFGTGDTAFEFSAATPGPLNNDIVINFTASVHSGPTVGVPTIVVTDHTIDIDLDFGEDLNGDGVLNPGEDLNRNDRLDGTTANAIRDAINANHRANQLVQVRITSPYETGFNNIVNSVDGATVNLTGAGDEQGVIDIDIENGDLRVVTDNSRPVFLEMRDGIDEFDPPDLAVAAVQSENTIRLKANTIEVFDDILAIQPLTQISTAIDDSSTTLTVIDPSVFPNDGSEFFIQINAEILKVTAVDGHDLSVERGQNGTTAVSHVANTVIANINVDNGIRQYIDLQARTNFVLGADRVISTDDHYINSLHVAEDLNGNGILDLGEAFSDANSNGAFDGGEAFTDLNGNNIFDGADQYYDANNNLQFDAGESFTDSNGNKKYDAPEDFNSDEVLQFNPGEDTNRNGLLDLDEDLNGDGILQLRGDKPLTVADDDFFSSAAHDVIHITADSTFSGTNGRVLLGDNSTISTDNGIEQQISPRPFRNTGTDSQHSEYTANSAFFSGEIVVSNLQSRFLTSPEQLADGRILPSASIVYLGTMTFTIGAPGEKNLILDVDWGDHDRTVVSPVPPVLANTLAPKFVNGIYVFDPAVDQHATRFLIPEGGATYSIPHDFPDATLNLKDFLSQLTIQEPGRIKPTDPFNVRFAVSQHSSIVIDGQSVLDPSVRPEDVASFAPADVPLNVPYDPLVNKPYLPDDPSITPTGSDLTFRLSSTNVLDDSNAFLPRFDNGVVSFVIPTNRATAFLPKTEPAITPSELPKPFFRDAATVSPSLLTTESSRSSAASSSVTTDEYFELRRIDEDGSVESTERLTGTKDGELLLSNRDLFEQFINERGDGGYEIWFITKDTRDGALIERPVIQFRLKSGRIATPADETLKTFQPLKLVPVPADPANSDADAANADDEQDQKVDADSNDRPDSARLFEDSPFDLPTQKKKSLEPTSSRQPTGPADGDDPSVIIPDSSLEKLDPTTQLDSSSAEATSLAASVLILAGARRFRRRSNPTSSSLFSNASRWTRKQIAAQK
ncbi:hypothetical protein LBMAG52_34850 [Planctomycetia bacterium]|nr:hypothetical protein LBMAG52_34850 [Planctomycetia bacterium]